MLGLPIAAVVVVVIVVTAIVGIGAFLFAQRRRLSFRRFFGVDPKSGTPETVKGVARQVLHRIAWRLKAFESILNLYSNLGGQAVDTETASEMHLNADMTRRDILKQKSDLAQGVVLTVHFDLADIVREEGLVEYLPVKVARS